MLTYRLLSMELTAVSSYTECIDLNNSLNIASGIDSNMENLVNELNNGTVMH